MKGTTLLLILIIIYILPETNTYATGSGRRKPICYGLRKSLCYMSCVEMTCSQYIYDNQFERDWRSCFEEYMKSGNVDRVASCRWPFSACMCIYPEVWDDVGYLAGVGNKVQDCISTTQCLEVKTTTKKPTTKTTGIETYDSLDGMVTSDYYK